MKTTFLTAIVTTTFCASLQAEPVFRLTPSDGAPHMRFGKSIAACGDYVIIGAGGYSMATNAYIYHRTATGWEEQARLVSSAAPTNSGKFGHSVAMGQDYAVVGAPDEYQEAGRAYVFARSGTNWTLDATFAPAKIVPEPSQLPYFGRAVAAHGDLIAVGAPLGGEDFPGSVFLYRRTAGVWQFEAQLSMTNNPGMRLCGWDVAVCGETVAMLGQLFRPPPNYLSAEGVLIFQKDAGSWKLVSSLSHSQRSYAEQLAKLALTTNVVVLGDWLATNAIGEQTGAAFLFHSPPGGWAESPLRLQEDVKLLGTFVPEDFGASVAADGDIVTVGATGARRVQVLRRDGGNWLNYSSLRVSPSSGRWGEAVAISSGRVFVTSPNEERDEDGDGAGGAAYIFGALSPVPPSNPAPTGAIETNSALTWVNGEPSTSLDLYFNLGASPTNKVLDHVAPVSTYNPGPLQTNRLYSWQVVNRNAYGETAGPVWSFGIVGPPDLVCSPTNIPFGSLVTNTVSTPRAFTIENPGFEGFQAWIAWTNPAFWVRLEGLGAPTNYLRQFNVTLAAGSRTNLLVVFAPTNTGHFQDTITLRPGGEQNPTDFVNLSGDGVILSASAPANPSPPTGATDRSVDTDLRWENGTGTTAVDLLFSRSGQPLAYLLSNAAPVTTYALPRLLYDTTYQWQVVCRSGGGSAPGPVWTFTTGHPQIEVYVPNGREAWRVGTPHAIEWLAKDGAATVQLDLCVLDPNGHLRRVAVLATNVLAEAGSFTWNIDPHLPPGDGYLIRVRDEWDLSYYDQSDGPFALTPTIHVISPNGGELVRAGAPCNITWLGEALGGDVSVEIQRSGGSPTGLGTVPNTGSLVWNVPCDLEERGLRAYVVWTRDESLNDLSDASFDTVVLLPDQASNPSPANRAENVSRTPTLTWTNGAGDCTIEVWIGLADPPDELLYSGGVTNSFPVTHALRAVAAHYWRVVSRNRAGATNGPVWRFTTMAAIQAPRLTAPVRNGNHLEFQWTPYQAGMQYRLQCTTNLSVAFADVAVLQTNRYWHTNALLSPTRFYRVRAEVNP